MDKIIKKFDTMTSILLQIEKHEEKSNKFIEAVCKGIDFCLSRTNRFKEIGLNGQRWPQLEEYAIKNPACAYFYAESVIKGRWPEAEEIIKQDPAWAYYYAESVIKGRWPEAEEIIKQDPAWAYYYAIDVIKGRWPEIEKSMEGNLHFWKKYLKLVCKECKGQGFIDIGIGGAEEQCMNCMGGGFSISKLKSFRKYI